MFARQNLFAGVTSFAALEARIAALPDEQSRGGAFEVFAEAYLATQRKHDAAMVWPLPSVPTGILQTLGLVVQDHGVDGVFETLLGSFNAYQVKFRTNRPALTWRELSTFMGLADSTHIHSRVLLTNCDELPSVLNERHGFFCIRGSDFDRLEADDFRAVEAWLVDTLFTAPKKQPQPHQTEALNALLPALRQHDRLSAIMACGTGKTLVALWIAERMQASRILVLVPSLALLRQILHEWLRETNQPVFAYHCVCSDPTVKEGIDAIATKQADLDFQVSTDAQSVRDFLDAQFTGTRILFSTYQSAQVVGAALKSGETFDLAVFDEAHKTAGREGRNYAFALEDANLPIRKRLFLTATPRHYNPHQHDREGDAQLVYSMDRPEVYGPQAYRLTFADAARRGIICGYKVIISVITSEMVTNELLSRGEVVVNGDAVRARQVANQIALRNAIEKYGVSKVFTFHKTVESAASFVTAGSEGVRTHLPEFETFHVNGTMPTARREREMRDFRAAARAVMSNARCLTEGVDVPAVDMVAFLSPRRSRVDIVQATGRAVRVAPGKTTGFVLVPLYVELAAGENVKEAVQRSEFDEVWDVLQAMQDQDDVLAEIIRDMREERGRTKGFDDSRFRERIVFLGPPISLDILRTAITTICIKLLGKSWDERYGELKAFKNEFGDCNVPREFPQNRELGKWVQHQRSFKRKAKLACDRLERLNSIGFVWDRYEAYWEEMFRALLAFKRKHDHCAVPRRWPEDQALSTWVGTQRGARTRGKLTSERIRRLEEIGFVWNQHDATWERMFGALSGYKHKHGDCNVPRSWKENPALNAWLGVQRQRWKKNKLRREHTKRLEQLGVLWQPLDEVWEQMFLKLVEYKKKHGNCLVPKEWPADPEFGSWVATQRRFKKHGALSADRIRRLDELRFVWHTRASNWETMFLILVEFHNKHSHCLVPDNYSENPRLASWVSNQRSRRRALGKGRIQRLDGIGFTWNSREARWQGMLESLREYRNRFGNCDIPRNWPENPKLSWWVQTQRQLHRRGKLSADRIRRLDEIGVTWTWRKARGMTARFK